MRFDGLSEFGSKTLDSLKKLPRSLGKSKGKKNHVGLVDPFPRIKSDNDDHANGNSSANATQGRHCVDVAFDHFATTEIVSVPGPASNSRETRGGDMDFSSETSSIDIVSAHNGSNTPQRGMSSRIKELEEALQRETAAREAFKVEIVRAQDQLQQIQRAMTSDKHRQLEQEAAWSQREHELSSALADAENRLRAIKADGAAARIFAESEDIDGKAIVDRFSDVVEGVSDLAFCVMEKLDEDVLAATISLDRVRELTIQNEPASYWLHNFLVSMAWANAKVELAVLPSMQALIFGLLERCIFRQNSLAGHVPPEVALYIQSLRARTAAIEPQEKYGRWRAMTYNAMRVPEGDHKLVDALVSHIFETMFQLVATLLPSGAANPVLDGLAVKDKLFGDLTERATKLLHEAIKLQDMMQRVYVSRDYYVFFPATNSRFLEEEMIVLDLGPDTMKDLEGPVRQMGGRGSVLLPAGPGLKAARIGAGGSRVEVVVKKASVIAVL